MTTKAKGPVAKRPTQKKAKARPTVQQLAADAVTAAGIPDEVARDLVAMIGTEGHAVRPTLCDPGTQAALLTHVAAEMRSALSGQFSNKKMIKFDIFDDCGLTPFTEPTLHFKALRDRITKMLTSAGVASLIAPLVRVIRDGSGDPHSVLLSYRGLALVSDEVSVSDFRRALRSARFLMTTAVPGIRLSVVDPDNLEGELGQILAISSRAFLIQVDEQGQRSVTPVARLSPLEAVRVAEILSGIPLDYMISGRGPGATAIASTVKTKVNALQRGRPNEGSVLSVGFDAWPLWSRVLRTMDSSAASFRTDIPLRKPKAPKKPKSSAQRNREQRAKRLKRHRMFGA